MILKDCSLKNKLPFDVQVESPDIFVVIVVVIVAVVVFTQFFPVGFCAAAVLLSSFNIFIFLCDVRIFYCSVNYHQVYSGDHFPNSCFQLSATLSNLQNFCVRCSCLRYHGCYEYERVLLNPRDQCTPCRTQMRAASFQTGSSAQPSHIQLCFLANTWS